MQESLYDNGFDQDQYVRLSTLQDNVANLQSQINAATPGSGLISGNVSWSGSGFIFDVTATLYKIDGVLYATAPQQVVLAASDPTFDRIDVIAVDNNGGVVVLTGTPGATPVKPQVDPQSQIELSFITVEAGTTAPTTPVEDIYLDNAEWTGSTNGSVDFNSTVLTHQGAKSILTTTTLGAGKYIALSKGAPYAVVGGNLTFWIKLNNIAVVGGAKLNIQFYNGGSPVGNSVFILGGFSTYYGVIGGDTTNWQLCSIPMSAFGALTTVDELRFFKGSGPSNSNFFLDYIRIETGLPVPQTISGPNKWSQSFWPSDFAVSGDYTWNGLASIGAATASILNQIHRLYTFNGADNTQSGIYTSFTLPSDYVAGSDIKITVNLYTNSAAGNAVFYLGLTHPTATGVLGGESETEWIKKTIIGAAGYTVIPTEFIFSGANLHPGDMLAIRLYRDPNDANDTLATSAYFHTFSIEEV